MKISYDSRKNKVSDFDMDIFSVDFLEETDTEQEETQEEDDFNPEKTEENTSEVIEK